MTRTLFGIASFSLALTACADLDVGQAIPFDQVYYPLGMAVLDGEGAAPRVAVFSTNYDQRYQSGQVGLLDTSVLMDGLLEAIGLTGTDDVCSSLDRPRFFDSYAFGGRSPWVGRVKVPGVGGGIVVVPDGAGGERLYVTNRLNAEVITIRRDGDELACRGPGEDEADTIRNSDCGPSHINGSGAEDPFEVAFTVIDGRPYLGVTHLFPYADRVDTWGVVSLLDEALLAARATADDAGAPYQTGLRLFGMTGLSGVAATAGAFHVLGLNRIGRLELATVRLFEDADETPGPDAGVSARLRLDTEGNAAGGRGMVQLDERRLLASVRYELPGVGRNAGLAVVEVGTDRLEAIGFVDVGSEIGKPSLRPRLDPSDPMIAYVGDLDTDKLYAVDVTQDRPFVVAELLGRAPRDLPNGRRISAFLLDGPTRIAFFRHRGRLYGLVANFANATLAVLDATDPDPRKHCLLARLGRDIDGNGEAEAERR